LLYLPNEKGSTKQLGERTTFAELEREGEIRELGVYSFLADYLKDRDSHRAHRELLDVVTAFKPDILYWQHPVRYPLDISLIREVRRRAGNPLIVYDEGDPFDSFYKRVWESEISLYRECDVFFTTALGAQRRLFENLRLHPHFYHCPSFFIAERAGPPPVPELVGSKLDAVMIGSISHRLKVLKHPGSAERIALARALTRSFGNGFATFGNGWPAGTNCNGLLNYLQQTPTIQSARMSVIWENFPQHTFYFSDRLPISMASGIPHITSRRPGYDILLADAPGLFLADTVQEAVDIATYLRSQPIQRIVELGLAARKWVFAHFESDIVVRRAFRTCVDVWRKRLQTGAL